MLWDAVSVKFNRCTPVHIAAQFNQRRQAACISVELATSCHAVLRTKQNITEGVADLLRPVLSNVAAL